MNKFVIVSFLQPFPGVFLKSEWPLHLTIIRPFVSDKEPKELVEELEYFCSSNSKVKTVGKSIELFGKNGDIPVIELENTSDLQVLHDNLLMALKPSITFENEGFPTYRPHVTKKNEEEIGVGDPVCINTLALVGIDEEVRVVFSYFELQ